MLFDVVPDAAHHLGPGQGIGADHSRRFGPDGTLSSRAGFSFLALLVDEAPLARETFCSACFLRVRVAAPSGRSRRPGTEAMLPLHLSIVNPVVPKRSLPSEHSGARTLLEHSVRPSRAPPPRDVARMSDATLRKVRAHLFAAMSSIFRRYAGRQDQSGAKPST